MNAIEIISQDLFDKVRSRFPNLQMGDEAGAVTLEPKDARFFDFDFTLEGHELGRISISINEIGSLKVYYSQGILEGVDSISAGMWYDFLKEMRQFAKRRLLRFDTRDITKGNLDKNDFQYLAQNGTPQENNMNEASYYGSSMSSYRNLDDTKLILRHSKAVEEGQPGARSRHISAIFIENSQGERFKYPYIHLAGAKAMQRHVANGGYPYDDAGQAIVRMSEQINQLGRFKRQFNGDLLNDDVNTIVTRAKTKLESLRHNIDKISKQAHYEAWLENLETEDVPTLDEVTLADYKTKFTVQQFDETLTDVFPLLHAIMKESDTVELEGYVSENSDKCTCDKDEDTCPIHGVEESMNDSPEYDAKDDYDLPPSVRKEIAKKKGQPHTLPDWKKHEERHKRDFRKRLGQDESFAAFEQWADNLDPMSRINESEEQSPEEKYHSMEYLMKTAQDIKHGRARATPEMENEFYDTLAMLGMPYEKIMSAWERITGTGYKPDPTLRRGAPKMDVPSDDDGEVDPDIAKYKGMAKRGSIGTDDFGAEMGEEKDQEEEPYKEPTSAKQLAELVASFVDQDGNIPKGETGVQIHVERLYGPRAGTLAKKLLDYIVSKRKDEIQMEAIRRLCGLPPLNEKKTMSRIGKGIEKYTKPGIKALAKAGREGKSEAEMNKIRDKYDQYKSKKDKK